MLPQPVRPRLPSTTPFPATSLWLQLITPPRGHNYTEAPKYYSAPNYYTAAAPSYYVGPKYYTEAPVYYSTTYAAPSYT
jgi:hypothetical protein